MAIIMMMTQFEDHFKIEIQKFRGLMPNMDRSIKKLFFLSTVKQPAKPALCLEQARTLVLESYFFVKLVVNINLLRNKQ